MQIKIKTRENKFIKVDVRDKDCRKKSCFGYHRYIHQGLTIDGGNTTRQEDNYSCCNRNNHGCPD